jgi:hypothetical protein
MTERRPLPGWPRRMKLSLAAAYVDESESKFLAGVKAGKWPHGRRDGGNVYWYLEDLDAALDRLKPAEFETEVSDNNDSWDDFVGQT